MRKKKERMKERRKFPPFFVSSKLSKARLASLSPALFLPSTRSRPLSSFFSPVVPQWLHGPPARDDDVAFPAALTVGEGVEGRRGVEDEEGDAKSKSIFCVLVVIVGNGINSVGAESEKAQPSALEASSGLAARSRPVSSKIMSR